MNGNISWQNILSFLSLLVSSGAIGYAIRLVIKIEVLEHLFNEKKEAMEDLSDRQNKTESDVLRLGDGMASMRAALNTVVDTCRELPSINEKLSTILQNMSNFVPRSEIDSKVERLKDRVDDNSSRLKTMDAKIALQHRPVVLD